MFAEWRVQQSVHVGSGARDGRDVTADRVQRVLGLDWIGMDEFWGGSVDKQRENTQRKKVETEKKKTYFIFLCLNL